MDIKAKAEELVAKIKGDKNLLAKFKEEPVKTIEGLLGVDLPDEKVKQIADLVKAKIGAGDVAEKVGGIAGKLGGLFGNKK